MATFHLIPSDCVDFLPLESLELLEKSCKRTPANVLSVQEILTRAKLGMGSIYLVKEAHKLLGIIYLAIFPTEDGGVLNIIMLGAKNLLEWKDDLREFVRKLMINNNIKDLCVETRDGWGKLFPELKPVGTIYLASMVH